MEFIEGFVIIRKKRTTATRADSYLDKIRMSVGFTGQQIDAAVEFLLLVSVQHWNA